jgi:hypothetical protein
MTADAQLPELDPPLSPLARRLVEVLTRANGRVVSRAALIDELWAGNHLVGEPALNRLVSEARRALRSAGCADLIETVQRSGYRWAVNSEPAAARPVNYRPWVLAFLAAIILLGLLGWLSQEAMGLLWVARHG